MFEGLTLQTPPLSVAVIHRKVCELARQHELTPPSYSLVYDVVRQLPPALMTLAHQGAKAYHQRFDLLHRREAEAPNAVWQADHCWLDILLVRDGQTPAKPWLTVILDDYSRALAGYFLTFEAPSALQTSLALRQAIWHKDEPRWHVCGIPQVLYTDRGSDFISQHLEQVSIDLHMRLTNSLPGQPRGRGRIERFFKTVQQMLLCELPGYAPPQGPVRGAPQLTLGDLDTRFRAFILGVYHARPHSETQMPPQQRWEAGGFLPQMPDSLEQLDLVLLTVPKPRTVLRNGIRFLGQRYLDPTLAAYVGESVILQYDPRADLYLGAAITGFFDTSFTLGGRVGHYFERLPWLGLAFDASFWQPDAELTLNGLGTLGQIDLTVVPLSALVFVRVPGLLPTADVPRGRVQPYLALGPSLVISDADITLPSGLASDTSVDLGLDLRVGLGWRFTRTVGIFAEYRFSYVNSEFEDTVQGVQVSVDADLPTHHTLVGVSLRF